MRWEWFTPLTDHEELCSCRAERSRTKRKVICKGQRLSTEGRTLTAGDRHPKLLEKRMIYLKARQEILD